MTLRTIIVAAALALPLSAAPAAAQFLTFVSATGNDANTCFVQANPCKTLQRAINQTSPGGELRLLTSLSSNGFIDKSITIEGGYNTVIGTIAVNSASAIVRFRRLSLNGRHAFPTGFNLINAAAVHIEDCSVERYTGNGVLLGANVSTELVIANSVSRDNGLSGARVSAPTTAKVTVEDSSFDNNGFRGILLEAGQGTISRTTFLGNARGPRLEGGGTMTATETTVVGSADTGFSLGSGQLTLVSCDALGQANEGLFLGIGGGLARISDCVFTGNGVGIGNNFGATVSTLSNNLIAGNTTNVAGTAPAPLAPE